MDLDAVLTRSPDAAYRVYDGQATIVLPSRAEVHVTNEVGSAVWEALDGRRSLRQILETVLERFDVGREQATADLLDFVRSLQANGMVI